MGKIILTVMIIFINTIVSFAQETGYAHINGEQIYYEIYGKGFPVILLHGGLGSISEFKSNIPDLSKEFRVIAVDSRGYG